MGYRSAIYIKIKNEDRVDFQAKLRKAKLDDSFTEKEVNRGDGFIRYIGENLKWYESYPDVKIINDFINEEYETRALLAIGEDGMEMEYGDCCELELYSVNRVEW